MNKKKMHFIILLFLLFLIVSFLFISPAWRREISPYHSSALKLVTVKNGNQTRTDFVDENGKITVAANDGYATKIVTETEYGELEEYFDDQGKPARRYWGNCALKREYLENGNKMRLTYLDAEGIPLNTLYGYAVEERVYDPQTKTETDRYYDQDGHPYRSYLYGYGNRKEIDDKGNVIRITYFDENENPMVTGFGYASVSREYYLTGGPENGRVKKEFYFDEKGKPIILSLGQYGEEMEYDESGRNSVITYLDADGDPIANKQGYTTVVRTFHADNSIETERYFDAVGKPYALAAGQYGIKTEEGRTVYLDENGNERFDLKNLLYNHSRLVIPAALILVVMASLVGPKGNWILLVLYLAVIAYVTLMFRENDEGRIRLIPFWSYRQILFNSGLRADIFRNIWLFVPLGAILYRLYPKWTVLLVPFALSAAIEAVQYFAGIGFCELDDVVSNGLGGLIGYGSGKVLKELISKIPGRRRLNNAKTE